MSVRRWLASKIYPEVFETEAVYDALIKSAEWRVSLIPDAVNEKCQALHANGAYGWYVMKQCAPFAALAWAHEVEIEMLAGAKP